MKVKFKFMSREAAEIYGGELKYAHSGDSCVDLYSVKDYTVGYGFPILIDLGIALEIPNGYEAFIYSRSSTPLKKGLFIPNGLGVIDSGYRGELKMIAYPLPGIGITEVKKREKIAQLQVRPRYEMKFEVVEELNNSARGAGGFGSTGN